MKLNYLFLIVLLMGLTGCPLKNVKTPESQAVQHTGTGILVIKSVTFSRDATIRDAVKKECSLPGKLTQFIEKNAASQYEKILSDSNPSVTNTQVLAIEIEQVQGTGGGAWSGAKSVLVKGRLTKNGRALGDFKARRYSGGGAFGAYKGTCAILGRCVKTLGKDIATWLKNPTSNAVLGDM